MPGSWEDRQAGEDGFISELIWRSRLALGLSQELLAELFKDPYAIPTRVDQWERGMHIPGPYWRDSLGPALDLPGSRMERAAARARLRRIFVAGNRLGDA
ncbi:MAG: transcriptional regulator [Micromonosporaceae bacterium]|nr:transcriptional regulator [Micromonosporaceae bacterium]